MSKVYKQDPKLPQGKWIDENKSGPRSFQEVADAMYDTPEATPSPDVLKLHTDIIRQLEQEAKALRQSLTAAQAELQRLREELKIVIGICSSDTLPRKESK